MTHDGSSEIDRALEAQILELLEHRAPGRTICPSEAARAVASGDGGEDDDVWRELMDPARAAALRLVEAGEVEMTQGGEVVDPATARGPVRLRRAR
ncbi:MAG TPA: DUF3253 domain-containing protein [Marmoricola sp.]|nr:DUF3253 domain-containing protein [Marmoricola sp.]